MTCAELVIDGGMTGRRETSAELKLGEASTSV
jgi:hypothetical protein